MKYYWLNEQTSVCDSLIHGKGRSATSALYKDEVICVAGGLACSKKNTKWETGLLIDSNLILQLPLGSEYEAYLNHSCNPNIYIDGQIVFRALRDINIGEELTIDYASFMIVDRAIIEQCTCRSTNCRGKIRGDDFRRINLPLSWYAQKRLKS